MRLRSNGTMVGVAAGAVAVCLVSLVSMGAQAPPPQKTEPSSKPLMAEQYFKNIQVLRGIPVDEFMGTMGFIAAATGMNCVQCHVEDAGGDWKKYADDTPLKQTTRKMILMVNMLNRSNFGGKREVTCYSCHRGGTRPQVIPDLDVQYAVPTAPDPDEVNVQTAGAPTVDEVFDKYMNAVGGAKKLATLTSFVAKGNYVNYDDPSKYPAELYAKASGQRTLILHTPSGDNTTVCDGASAWTAAPLTDVPQPVIVLSGQNLDGAKFDAAVAFPARIRQSLHDWRVGPLGSIDDHDVRIVQGTGSAGELIKLYFDPQSGLLVRQQRTANTPIGAIPTRVDYSDYRDVGGIKMPFHITMTWTDGRTNLFFDQIQPNAPIEAAKFAEPRPSAPPPAQ